MRDFEESDMRSKEEKKKNNSNLMFSEKQKPDEEDEMMSGTRTKFHLALSPILTFPQSGFPGHYSFFPQSDFPYQSSCKLIVSPRVAALHSLTHSHLESLLCTRSLILASSRCFALAHSFSPRAAALHSLTH
jgi:hypothetical protein